MGLFDKFKKKNTAEEKEMCIRDSFRRASAGGAAFDAAAQAAL